LANARPITRTRLLVDTFRPSILAFPIYILLETQRSEASPKGKRGVYPAPSGDASIFKNYVQRS
jgi:hypothetical protein